MVKITADLISRSAQYLNPVKEFQLDLRGYKIPAIENLSATNDQFGCIDLSDNSISLIEPLPRLHRLRTILLSNNRIIKVDKEFAIACPNLENLILTANKVIYFLINNKRFLISVRLIIFLRADHLSDYL
jgi:U2 small nuclear ribonucleoprotein A'